jgi:FkbM family methyltransferase
MDLSQNNPTSGEPTGSADDFSPAIWWTAQQQIETVDDLLKEIPHRSPKVAEQVRVIYAVGANQFQEHELLLKLFPNIEQIYLFEPIPKLVEKLEKATADLDYVRVFPYALTDFEGVADFHITNNLESSSLLELEKHKEVYPWVEKKETVKVQCRKLETVMQEFNLRTPDLLFIDVQGAEYQIISSLTDKLLSSVKLLYTEASTIEFYKGAKNLLDIQNCLKECFYFLGFSAQENRVRNHGNALFINKSLAYTLPDAPPDKQHE